MCLRLGYHVAEEYYQIKVFQSFAGKITNICLVGFFEIKKICFKKVNIVYLKNTVMCTNDLTVFLKLYVLFG